MFKDRLIKALGEGLLMLIKYGLIIALIIYGLNFSGQTREMAQAGNNAALTINAYIQKGWLPKPVDGFVPDHK